MWFLEASYLLTSHQKQPVEGACNRPMLVTLATLTSAATPCILFFVVGGLNSWEGLRFWNLSLRMLLRGQCSISYDLDSWFRGRRSTSEAWFGKMNPLRGSWVSSVRNAGKVAFSDFEVQPTAEITCVDRTDCWWSCVFWFQSAICGDRACPSGEMLVK